MKRTLILALSAVLTIMFASCGRSKPEYYIDELDSIIQAQNEYIKKVWEESIVLDGSPQSSHPKCSFPQITSFEDYVYEKQLVLIRDNSDSVGFLHQLDLEFPTKMNDPKVLAKIQEQLLDTIFPYRYHTTSIEKVLSDHWKASRAEIKRLSEYPSEVPNDSDEYFEYKGIHNIHFDHLCGRTIYNENGLYIMRHHYAWYDGGCHHLPDTKYLSFDTRTGEYIRFTDIFSEEYEDTLHHMIYDISFVVDDMLRDKYPNIHTQYWDEASFTIKPNALVLHYTHYTLGCWADGEHEIEIPSYIARLFLNDNWKHLW